MISTLKEFGEFVRLFRDDRGKSQESLAQECGIGRAQVIGDLERGLRAPPEDVLRRICTALGIPEPIWLTFVETLPTPNLQSFSQLLSEIVGHPLSLADLDIAARRVLSSLVTTLFGGGLSAVQLHALLSRILVFFGISPMSRSFFDRYFSEESFGSSQHFRLAIERYQSEAIRLYSTFWSAYTALNASEDVSAKLAALEKKDISHYRARAEWNSIDIIQDDRLSDLGYISAARFRREHAERERAARFLRDLAARIREHGKGAIANIPERTRRAQDGLLRQLGTVLPGLFSPLYAPDAERIEREADRIAPRDEEDLKRLEMTQAIALANLSQYLTADYLDVYIATSMRTDADFVSVNHFAKKLFDLQVIRPLKLRYFNPTQSWIEDRVAKGLVEALMLRRASLTIYMAQLNDTFGKDSEASVALGQGKPVIVYAPKLVVPEVKLDTEDTGALSESDLRNMIRAENEVEASAASDELTEREALHAYLVELRLKRASNHAIVDAARRVWADFNLEEEAKRIDVENPSLKADYRRLIDSFKKETPPIPLDGDLRNKVIGILVANAMDFERRAKVFREVHPLALQVILSTGVLNGILVCRSVESCGKILRALLENKLDLGLVVDSDNYRLVEKSTNSTVRVISKHPLISNAFEAFYHPAVASGFAEALAMFSTRRVHSYSDRNIE